MPFTLNRVSRRYLLGTRLPGPTDTTLVFDVGFDSATTDTRLHAETVTGSISYDTVDKKAGAAALVLNGGDNYINYANASNLDVGAQDFTFEMWVKPVTWSDSGPSAGKIDPSTAMAPYTFQPSGGNLYFWSSVGPQWYVGAPGSIVGPSGLMASVASLANAWHHIAVTRKGTAWNLWIDGLSVNSFTSSHTPYTNTAPIIVGVNAYRPGGPYIYKGKIDRIKLYRRALYTGTFTPPTTV